MTQHRLKLHIAKDIPTDPGIVGTKIVKIRERIARVLFGAPRRMMIIIPGDSVDEINIREKPDDSLMALAEAVGVAKGGEAK